MHVLVIPRIPYFNAHYMGLLLKLDWKLQQVQNAEVRLVLNLNKFEYISLALACLRWLPVLYWARFKVLVLTYKVLDSLVPRYLRTSICAT